MARNLVCDVVIIGAGMVGAACAYYAARAGLDVIVVDRASVAGGTTGAGEGNLLVSDKPPGPELGLALLSERLWRELTAEQFGAAIEYEPKGGLVVAQDEKSLDALNAFADGQSRYGVHATPVAADSLSDLEPHLASGLAGGVFYPQDAQVQPALAAAHLIRAAAGSGAKLRSAETVTHLLRTPSGAMRGVRRPRRDPRTGGRECGRRVGRRSRGARRGRVAGLAAPGLHPGDRAFATAGQAQGLRGRLRGRRRQRFGGAADLAGGRGDRVRARY